jgi:hypothetical protein
MISKRDADENAVKTSESMAYKMDFIIVIKTIGTINLLTLHI